MIAVQGQLLPSDGPLQLPISCRSQRRVDGDFADSLALHELHRRGAGWRYPLALIPSTVYPRMTQQ